MKKFTIKILIIIFMVVNIPFLPAFSFSFMKEKKSPLDIEEKLEYINMDYWKRYSDEYLVNYIYQAVCKNHDARKASWAVEEYRQNMKYILGGELPSLTVGANYLGAKVPEIGDFSIDQNAFILPFIARYEPDIFLKNRNKTQSAKKAYEASKYDEKGIYIALAGDVAASYVNILQYDKLINLQKQIVAVKLEELKRIEKRYKQGTINNIDLNTTRQNLETEKNNLGELCKSREQMLTQFALLIGISPDCTNDILRGRIESFEYLAQVPDCISSDVIFSRPDVMAAESNLIKSNIDVKVARKELLPSFNIIGVWIFNTMVPGTFFSWDSSIAALLAGATQPLFMGGRKIANVKISKSKYEQMFEEYRQTDLKAVKEVNDALYIVKQDINIDNNTIKQLNLEIKNYQNSSNMYSQGTISYPDLLNKQISLLNTEQNQVQTKTTRLVNYFTLYKAVGGKL